MALGHLWEFTKVIYEVDFDKFFNGKVVQVTQLRTWEEYKKDPKTKKSVKSGEVLGVRITGVIISDNTSYKLKDDELSFSNELKEVTFKLPSSQGASPVKVGDKICGECFRNQGGYFRPIINTVVPYGPSGTNFKNELSIVVDGFEWVEKKK